MPAPPPPGNRTLSWSTCPGCQLPITAIRGTTAEAVYNLACIEALSGRPDAALSDLNRAVEHGLSTNVVLVMATDPDLKSLGTDPRFKAIVADAKRRAAAAQQSK